MKTFSFIKPLYHRPLLLILILALGVNASAQAKKPALRDINSYLRNETRTDVGGEGLWLPGLDGKLTRWITPAPGFTGQVYYVHATAFAGLFQYEFQTRQGASLTAVVVKHEWTPAYTRTRYSLNDEDGRRVAALEETKFINDSEQAFSRVRLSGNDKRPVVIRVRIKDLLAGNRGEAHKPANTPVNTPANTLVNTPENTIAGRLIFNPTTYYFTDLEIRKVYLLAADRFAPADESSLLREIRLNPKTSASFTARLAFGDDFGQCARRLRDALKTDALIARVNDFNQWFASNVPAFTCSDKDFEKMYYYRWYVVKKTAINTRKFIPTHPYPAPVMYEGVAGRWFTKVIGLPLPLQIVEARWLNDKSIATGQARTAITKPDFFDYLNWTPWAIWQLHLVAPNKQLIKDALPAMENFTRSEEAKDEDRDALPTVWGTWITGMEYQPSFFYFTKPRWDHRLAVEFVTDDHLTKDPAIYKKYLPLERVDEATYYYLNNLAVAKGAALLGDSKLERASNERAASVRRSVMEKMWDRQAEFFYDIHPTTHEKALEAKTIDGFFPFLFGEMADRSEASVFKHLFNPKEFWSAWPVPTVAMDSPAYDSHGLWKIGPGASAENPYRYVTSWNGPSWLFSNSLVAEGLGNAARMSEDAALVSEFNQLMKKYTEIMFLGGNKDLPCTVEHYDSMTGKNIRLLADYFHSFYNDLLIRFMIGIVPREDDLIEIDPLAREWKNFAIRDVSYRNHKITVEYGRRFTVIIDGKRVLDSPVLKRFVYDPN